MPCTLTMGYPKTWICLFDAWKPKGFMAIEYAPSRKLTHPSLGKWKIIDSNIALKGGYANSKKGSYPVHSRVQWFLGYNPIHNIKRDIYRYQKNYTLEVEETKWIVLIGWSNNDPCTGFPVSNGHFVWWLDFIWTSSEYANFNQPFFEQKWCFLLKDQPQLW